MSMLISLAVAAALTAYAVWTLTRPEVLARLRARSLSLLGGVWARSGSATWQSRAQTLGWAPYRIPLIASVIAVAMEAVLAVLSPLAALVALLPAPLIGWGIALQTLRQAHARWQREMLRGLPGLITVLRVHLDLGRTVPDAMREALHGAPPVLREELRRALADMRTADRANSGLERLAERVDAREWRVFADTLTQAWDSRLAGAALEPLAALIQVVRDQAAQETTDRLDRVISAAPGLAIFAVVIWGAGGFVVSALFGGGGGL